jgi:hypothetical protein
MLLSPLGITVDVFGVFLTSPDGSALGASIRAVSAIRPSTTTSLRSCELMCCDATATLRISCEA